MDQPTPQFLLEADASTGFMAALVQAFPAPDLGWTPGAFILSAGVPHPLRVEISGPPGPPPDYLDLQGLALMSARLLERLRIAGVDNLQIFATQVVSGGVPMTLPRFSVVNVLGRLRWIDEARSDLVRRRGRLVQVRRLAPRAGGLMASMFVPHELPNLRVVSDRVHEQLRDLGGLRFTASDEWSL